jgi:hypothetical protein
MLHNEDEDPGVFPISGGGGAPKKKQQRKSEPF